MNQEDIAKYARRLHSWLAVRRRSACRKLAADSSASVLLHLAEALHANDVEVRSTANAALRALQSPETVDALCELAIAAPAGGAAVIVKEVDYQPQSVSRRCVLFLLTGQLERYLDLDFDFQHLRAEYQAGSEELRQRIGDGVRQSGDSRLIGLFRASRQRKLASELSEREAAILIEVRARNQQWHEIFALLFHIPLSSVIVGLDALDKADWRPQNEAEATFLDELFDVRSAIGNIPERPPSPDVTLGPVLTRWCERGRSPEFRGQSLERLRKTMRQAAPPEAVAALAALVANGQDTAEDLEAARTHPHWLVRLACLALCDLAPQFAFSAIPAESDGGEMWIARLAPAILDATLYRRRAVRLNLDELAGLQAALSRNNTQRNERWACGRLLEAMARHHLRDTIEVDEHVTVEIADTEIEIEG